MSSIATPQEAKRNVFTHSTTGSQAAAGQETRNAPTASTPSPTPTHDDIARRAYDIYIRSGKKEGRCAQNWSQAEQELKRAIAASYATPQTETKSAAATFAAPTAGGTTKPTANVGSQQQSGRNRKS
ncbi:MAG: DUF2934 domain-containing protein [Planctomycetota bacterium]|nr:DUF2934 domain-containing protein [Planctomycetota bacterium]